MQGGHYQDDAVKRAFAAAVERVFDETKAKAFVA